MNTKLLLQAVKKFISGFLAISLILFVSAGTLHFWNGWLFLAILFVPMLVVGIFLLFKNPELLSKRLNSKEDQSEQKEVLILSGIMFILGFITSGLNFRFKWFLLPKWLVILSCIIFILGYILYAEVMRENTYLSRTVEVQENQKVIDTGVYSIVRHPMYFSTVLLFLSIPLILGSGISFPIFCLYPFIIAKRIKNEEEVLERELLGYSEYKQKVKYKVIPFIW